MPPSRIQTLLEAQGDALAAMQDRDARAVLRLVEDARRELREALDALVASGDAERTRYTAQHLRVMLAQAESSVSALRRRLDVEMTTQAKTAGERALGDLLAVIKANEPEFRDAGGRVELRALTRLSREQGLLLHRYSIDRYGAEVIEAIQRELTVGLLRGQTRAAVVRRITGAGEGTMASKTYRAELIARMESNRAYGDMHQASLEEAAAELDGPGRADPLMRQMDEFFDARNSPFSRAAHEVVAAISQPFRVPVAEVRTWEQRLKRKSGVVPQVRIVGAFYEVDRYPAHFGDRGRQVPYRATWDRGRALGRMTGAQLIGVPERKAA